MIQLALVATVYVAVLIALFTSLQDAVAWIHVLLWPEQAVDSAALVHELRDIEASALPAEEPPGHENIAP